MRLNKSINWPLFSVIGKVVTWGGPDGSPPFFYYFSRSIIDATN